MSTHLNLVNEKTRVVSRFGRQSKTARKFTTKIGEDALPHAISVAIDWLSMMCYSFYPEPEPEQKPITLNDNIVLLSTNNPTKHFKHSWSVLWHGEEIANVFTHSRNEKMIKAGIVKLEILNHVFYGSELANVIELVMKSFNMTGVKNITRFDIALDGANHMHAFLNRYYLQPKSRSYPELRTLGRWDKENRVRMKGKARFRPDLFNRATGMCDRFQIGSKRKGFILYNKTSELERSHKEYIRQHWIRAGMDPEQTQWRCELRMDSEGIKQIKDLDFKRFTDPNYLLQIFKTQCENFFQFVINEGDGNVSRMRILDLFQFEKLKVPLLEKIPRAVVAGAYKAKMAIHNAVANIYKLHHKTEQSLNAAMMHITDNLNIYNLHRWYERKREQWQELYYNPVHYQGEAYAIPVGLLK